MPQPALALRVRARRPRHPPRASPRTCVHHGTWGVAAGHYQSASSSPVWTLLLAVLLIPLGWMRDYLPLLGNVACGVGILYVLSRVGTPAAPGAAPARPHHRRVPAGGDGAVPAGPRRGGHGALAALPGADAGRAAVRAQAARRVELGPRLVALRAARRGHADPLRDRVRGPRPRPRDPAPRRQRRGRSATTAPGPTGCARSCWSGSPRPSRWSPTRLQPPHGPGPAAQLGALQEPAHRARQRHRRSSLSGDRRPHLPGPAAVGVLGGGRAVPRGLPPRPQPQRRAGLGAGGGHAPARDPGPDRLVRALPELPGGARGDVPLLRGRRSSSPPRATGRTATSVDGWPSPRWCWRSPSRTTRSSGRGTPPGRRSTCTGSTTWPGSSSGSTTTASPWPRASSATSACCTRAAITDFYGLGDYEVLRAKQQKKENAAFLADLARKRGFDVAAMYPITLGFNVPKNWILVGQLELHGQAVHGHRPQLPVLGHHAPGREAPRGQPAGLRRQAAPRGAPHHQRPRRVPRRGAGRRGPLTPCRDRV